MNDNGQLKGVDEEALDFYQNNYLPTLSYVQKQDNDGSYKVVSLITHNAEKALQLMILMVKECADIVAKESQRSSLKNSSHLS